MKTTSTTHRPHLKPIPILFRPHQDDLDNPPKKVAEACERLGHAVDMFWCLRHGAFITKWEERDDSVDWVSCRCPECILKGKYC